jgi:small subunit ribosomal protein S16
MLKIRLAQTGTTNRKTYRIVAIEEGKRRNGKHVEILGYYNPLVKPPQIQIKKDRIEYWRKNGAQVTPAVEKLLK